MVEILKLKRAPGFLTEIDLFSLKMYTTQSAEHRRKDHHRFWLRLRHAVILISNDRTSASKKINGKALIRNLTDSTTAFDRTKENSMVFVRLYWSILIGHQEIELIETNEN